MKYEVITDHLKNCDTILRHNEDGSLTYIPTDEANSDYQSYLRWLNGEEENGTIS